MIDLLSWLIACSSVFSPFAAELILVRAYTTVDFAKGRAVLCIVAPNRLLHKKPRYYFNISFLDGGTMFGECTQIEMYVSSDIQCVIIRYSSLRISGCGLT